MALSYLYEVVGHKSVLKQVLSCIKFSSSFNAKFNKILSFNLRLVQSPGVTVNQVRDNSIYGEFWKTLEVIQPNYTSDLRLKHEVLEITI